MAAKNKPHTAINVQKDIDLAMLISACPSTKQNATNMIE